MEQTEGREGRVPSIPSFTMERYNATAPWEDYSARRQGGYKSAGPATLSPALSGRLEADRAAHDAPVTLDFYVPGAGAL